MTVHRDVDEGRRLGAIARVLSNLTEAYALHPCGVIVHGDSIAPHHHVVDGQLLAAGIHRYDTQAVVGALHLQLFERRFVRPLALRNMLSNCKSCKQYSQSAHGNGYETEPMQHLRRRASHGQYKTRYGAHLAAAKAVLC